LPRRPWRPHVHISGPQPSPNGRRINAKHLLTACLNAGDPTDEVNITWQCYQQLRSIYHATPAKGRQIAIKLLDSFHTCPIPEVARLGRTLRAWKGQILAYFYTHGVSNGSTEAIDLIIEKAVASPTDSKTLIIIDCESCWPPTDDGPTRHAPTMLNSEDPGIPASGCAG
jgi:Transposase